MGPFWTMRINLLYLPFSFDDDVEARYGPELNTRPAGTAAGRSTNLDECEWHVGLPVITASLIQQEECRPFLSSFA